MGIPHLEVDITVLCSLQLMQLGNRLFSLAMERLRVHKPATGGGRMDSWMASGLGFRV